MRSRRSHGMRAAAWTLQSGRYLISGQDTEGNIAVEREAWRDHLNRTGGCAGWNRGGDLRGRHHGERCGSSVKGDTGRAGEIVAQYDHRVAYVASWLYGFYERFRPMAEPSHSSI